MMQPEVFYEITGIQPRVQARCGEVGEEMWDFGSTSGTRFRCRTECVEPLSARGSDRYANAFPGHGQMKPDRAEIERLKREIVKPKTKRDILKKPRSTLRK